MKPPARCCNRSQQVDKARPVGTRACAQLRRGRRLTVALPHGTLPTSAVAGPAAAVRRCSSYVLPFARRIRHNV
jgi:hypothetical protein